MMVCQHSAVPLQRAFTRSWPNTDEMYMAELNPPLALSYVT